MNLGIGHFLVPQTSHIGTIGEHLDGVLVIFGVLDEFLVFACAALANTAEGEDGDAEQGDAADDADNDVFGRG